MTNATLLSTEVDLKLVGPSFLPVPRQLLAPQAQQDKDVAAVALLEPQRVLAVRPVALTQHRPAVGRTHYSTTLLHSQRY